MAAMLSRFLKPSRRWLQFSLRTMLFLTLAVAVWLGWFVDRAQRQKRAVEAIEAAPMGRVIYRHQLRSNLGPNDSILYGTNRTGPTGWPGPVWLCKLFGDEYFVEVVGVNAPLGEPHVVLKDLLQDLPWLEEVHITVQTPDDLASLRHLKRLKRLVISNWCSNFSMECLGDSSDLRFLSFDGEGKQPNFEHLEEFGNLRAVGLRSAAVADEAMPHLTALPRLERLVLDCNISDEGLSRLERLKRLETLTISTPNVTDAAAECLQRLTSLKELSIQGTKITDRGLELLANLPRLESLTLGGDHFTSEGLSRLNVKLTSLTLIGWRRPISDDDLEPLVRLRSLERLRIPNGANGPATDITDRGLKTLKKMTWLKEIYFASRYVTNAGISELKRALPVCQVDIFGYRF